MLAHPRVIVLSLLLVLLMAGCKQSSSEQESSSAEHEQNEASPEKTEKAEQTATSLPHVQDSPTGPSHDVAEGNNEPAGVPFLNGDPSDERFKKWITAVTEAEDLYVDDWWSADLDGDSKPERIAELCRRGPDAWHDSWYVVETSDGAVFTSHFRAQARAVCKGYDPSREPPPFELRTNPVIEMADSGMGGAYAERILGVRDGELVQLRVAESAGSARGKTATEYVLNWDEGRFWYGEQSDDEEADESPNERLGALITVQRNPEAAVLPKRRPAQNFVVHGADTHETDGDSSLDVTAAPRDNDTVLVRVMVEDDQLVPVPDDADAKQFIASDHVEIWWCTSNECLSEGGRKHARQLGIAADANGDIVARWLYPRDFSGPLPVVEGSPHSFVVTLPLSSMGTETRPHVMPAEANAYPFTVAYSDSDDASNGQETLIATSRLTWAEPSTFGQLVILPGYVRFPAARVVASGERITPRPAE